MATTTITSASTFADIEAEYLDTARYQADNDLTLAKRHAVACRFMLLKIPTNTVKGGNSISYSMSLIADQLKEAEDFIKSKRIAGGRFIRATGSKIRNWG